MLYTLISTYGLPVMTWAIAALAVACTALAVKLHASRSVLDALAVFGVYARDAVLQTWQTYVQAIKEGQTDGVLSEAEKAEAMKRALAAFLLRLNWRQLLQLGGGLFSRIFAGSSWAAKLETKATALLETAVADSKIVGRVANGGSLGPVPLPKVITPLGAPLPLPAPPTPTPRPR